MCITIYRTTKIDTLNNYFYFYFQVSIVLCQTTAPLFPEVCFANVINRIYALFYLSNFKVTKKRATLAVRTITYISQLNRNKIATTALKVT